MKTNELNFFIGGKGGEGIDAPGTIFAKICMAAGLHVHTAAEFQNVIKGYNNTYQIRVSDKPVYSHINHYDLMLALDKDTTDLYLDNVVLGGAVIYDPQITDIEKEGVHLFPVPLREIAKEKVGMEIAKNVVGMGAVFALLHYNLDSLLDILEKNFSKKGNEVVAKNHAAAKAGYDYILENFEDVFEYKLENLDEINKSFLANGNLLASMGAIKAGCKFVSEYPMTPSSSVLHYMAKYAREYDISVNHVEDEISAINMAIGAGFAGTRSMTATSGGGYALMTEAIGMSGMIETPVVIIEVQRPGPSTGLPTRTGQADLRQVLHASQGDFPHIVLSPKTHKDAFYTAYEAFNLAEIYQCPVTVLMEKYMAENYVSVPFLKTDQLRINRGKLLTEDKIDENFKRFETTSDGVSPRTIPSQKGGAHTASSYEHREDGYFTEKPDEVNTINEKRMRKMITLQNRLPLAELKGDENADVTLVCWGATYGAVRESMDLLRKEGISANMLHVKYLNPLQKNIQELLEKSKHLILVEGNIGAQLGGLLREKTGVNIEDKILDYTGRPFTPDGIAKKALAFLNK